jgi:GT2 family glycosyltransferase
MSRSDSFAIVVVGRNEGSRLSECLAAAARHAPGAPVVYVDSGSTDGSPETARAAGAEVLVLSGGRMSAARGRNAGWRSRPEPFILFLDADCVLEAGFPEASMDAIRADARIAAVDGALREIRPRQSVYVEAMEPDWHREEGPLDACGGNCLVRSAALEEVGGFDESLIAGEEPEMFARMRARGWTLRHIPAAMARHDLAITRFSQYWTRAFRTGYAYEAVARATRATAAPTWTDMRSRVAARVAGLSLGTIAAAAAGVLAFGPAGLAAAPLFLSLAVIRSAARARDRVRGPREAILYACHSLFQQFPIFLGQLAFSKESSRGRRGIIEYKTEAAL